LHRSLELRDRVRREADEAIGTDDLSHGGRREVVLPDVDAGRVREAGDVGAIVDDYPSAAWSRELDQLLRRVEQPRAGALLGAELNECRAARQKLGGDVEQPPARARCRVVVEDRVEG